MSDCEPKDSRLNWSALSQAERDAAYDNNKAVAGGPALIAARNTISTEVRALHFRTLDIAYGSAELPALVWDSRKLHEMRRAAGAPAEPIAVEGTDHFTILAELRRAGGLLSKAARSLVTEPG